MDNNGFVKDTPWQTNGDSGLHEECGVFGMYDFDGGDVASTIYYGLLHCSTVDRRAVVLRSVRRTDQRER